MPNTLNVFHGGLCLDKNYLDLSLDKQLTHALNATLLTFNGNENTLQNDLGNIEITQDVKNEDGELIKTLPAELDDGYIPIGVISFGGVLYIASCKLTSTDSDNPLYICLIGSFPSPEYFNSKDFLQKELDEDIIDNKLINIYLPLHVGTNLIPFETALLGFDFQHPVTIDAELSFDGSLNLILNDDKNPPRMINTGFAVTANNTCRIIKRYGSNNTNRYNLSDATTFNLQTSLYRAVDKLSKFTFNGLSTGGQLKVGNYNFYAVSCDKDGNETDIICESGVISVFHGIDGDPFSVHGGMQWETTDKAIKLTVENIDAAYSYIKLYYSVATSADDEFAKTQFFKIEEMFPVVNEKCDITVSGYEETSAATLSDININYVQASKVKAQALSQNILFLGNIELDALYTSNEHERLRKCALGFCPVLNTSKSVEINSDYQVTNNNSYYSSEFIYNYTGYHEEEIYRFGIVFIRNDNSKTDVFNVLGVDTIQTTALTPNSSILSLNSELDTISGSGQNNKGVSRIPKGTLSNLLTIIGIDFLYTGASSIFEEVKKNYKGFFFVRLKRIPTILCQGYSTNVCEEAFVPSLNVEGDNSTIYHYFESFATGSAQKLPERTEANLNPIPANYYPQRMVQGKGSSLYLRNNYRSRLFSLADKVGAYFDKYVGDLDPVLYYWANEVNFQINSDIWWGGPSITQYGPSDLEDDYCILIATNGDGTKHKYYVDFYFFKKLQGSSQAPAETETAPEFTVPSNTPENELEDKIKEVDEQRENYYKYADNDLNKAIRLQFDSWSTSTITPTPLNELYKSSKYKEFNISGSPEIPLYVCYNNTWYEFYCVGPHTARNYQEEMNRYCNDWFSHYRYIGTTTTEAASGEVTYTNGIDLTVPTFDGKYLYTKNIKDDDKVAVPVKSMEYKSYAVFCPEVELNQPYYNNILTGEEVASRCVTEPGYLTRNNRRYSFNTLKVSNDSVTKCKAINVPENVSLLTVEHTISSDEDLTDYIRRDTQSFFSSKVGDASNCNFKFAGPKFLAYNPINGEFKYSSKSGISDNTVSTDDFAIMGKVAYDKPYNMVRGIYGNYVGMVPENKDLVNCIVNLYIPGYSEDSASITNYFKLRYQDSSAYQSISDYISFTETIPTCYRGDCFINWYTHRVNRNFNDPSAPYNDTILDSTTFYEMFKHCFKPEYRTLDLTAKGEKDTDLPYIDKFNLGDLNAVSLGSWVTFPCRSSRNLALRANDGSWTTESLAAGHDRTFYPLYALDAGGSNKIPESTAFNSGYDKSGGDRIYKNNLANIYEKTYFKNRILYSNIKVNNQYSNGNRVFLETHYKDYSDLYGEIIKLLEFGGSLICVMEHGIMLIPVNERALAGEGAGGNVYINTSNVLPDNPRIISDTYGSLWAESIIKSPSYVYGVDAVAKKIWRTNGAQIELISDFAVLSFLNTTLSMYNKLCDIGLVNIKTHFNLFKNDVMFTAYDYEDLALWNLCYNENLARGGNGWVTFYSWIPSCSANIGNSFISLNSMVDYNLRTPELKIIHLPKSDILVEQANKLWVHGLSDFLCETENILPTHWYGRLHPFEFSIVVNKDVINHKIFNNVMILSNNVPPESFHYSVVGDAYELHEDKLNVYLRQELTKLLYATTEANGSDLGNFVDFHCNSDFTKLLQKQFTNVHLYVIFPWYYYRLDKKDLIEHYYSIMSHANVDFSNLSGTELFYDKILKEFRVCNHVKAVDLKTCGRLRGNMHYKEDMWHIQVNPIVYYTTNKGRSETGNLHLPSYIQLYDAADPQVAFDISGNVNFEKVNEFLQKHNYERTYSSDDLIEYNWTRNRKEMRVRDKFLEFTVRYDGTLLATIQGVLTTYLISYS